MAERPSAPLLFEVRPTAPQATEQHADIALTGLFSAHTSIINSERQAIWQRYNVMLAANSIVFAFLALSSRSKGELFIGAIFGTLLCAAWWIITVSGWRLFTMRIRRALQFRWPGFDDTINPFEVSVVYGGGRIGGMIYRVAVFVIVFFLFQLARSEMKTSSFSFRPSAVETQVQYRAALPRDGRAKRVPTIPRGLPRGTFIRPYSCTGLLTKALKYVTYAKEMPLTQGERLFPDWRWGFLLITFSDFCSILFFLPTVFPSEKQCSNHNRHDPQANYPNDLIHEGEFNRSHTESPR